MSKKVLLARPNYFLVNDMKNFLTENGYDPYPIKDLSHLNSISMADIKGVVVSTAVTSEVDESYDQVVKTIRTYKPKIPVIFASMVDYDMMKKSLCIKLESVTADPVIANIDNYDQMASKSSFDKLYLMLHKEEISKPELRNKAKQTVLKHFS